MAIPSRPVPLAAIALACALAAAATAAEPLYHLVDLGPSTASQINGFGEVSGAAQGRPSLWYDGAWHALSGGRKAEVEGIGNNRVAVGTHGLGRDRLPAALVWKPDGERVELAPDARLSYGTVIRSDGTAYGMLMPRGGAHSHPFRWQAGELKRLPSVAGWAWTKPNAANKALQIAGTGQSVPRDGQCPSEPLLFTQGSWLRLGSLGGDCGGANAINDFGVVVGFTTRAGSDAGHAFVWEDGVMKDLGSLGGGHATADDINADGVIVGYSADAHLDPHAVVWREGVITALDTVVDPLPEGTMVEAIAINGPGQILASGVGSDGRFHTWRLDPL